MVPLAKELAELALRTGAPSIAMKYCDEFIALAAKIRDDQTLKIALEVKSRMLAQMEKPLDQLKVNQQLLALSTKLEDSELTCFMQVNLGEVHLQLENADSALHYFRQAEKKIDNLQLESRLRLNNNLGRLYTILDYPAKAENYFRQNILQTEIHQDTIRLLQSLERLGVFLEKQSRLEEAESNILTAIELANSHDMELAVADLQLKLGNIKLAQKMEDRALDLFSKALVFYQKKHQGLKSITTQKAIGDAHLSQRNYWNALKSYDLATEKWRVSYPFSQKVELIISGAISLAHLNRIPEAIEKIEGIRLESEKRARPLAMAKIYKHLYLLYSKEKAYRKGLFYYQRWNSLKDSLFHQDQAGIIREMENKYQFEKAERRIVQLQKQAREKKMQLQQQRIFIAILFMTSVLCSGMAYSYYRNWVKNQIIVKQKKEIGRQQIAKLEKEKRLLSLKAMIEGQEQEGKRIAHDLHDGLGGLLSTVRLQFDSIDGAKFSLQQQKFYFEGRTLLNQACSEVRKLAHNMMPSAIAKFGLIPAIRDLCTRFEIDSEIKVNFQSINWANELSENRSIALYRIIQETLIKVVAPGTASEVIVQLARHEGIIHLTIEDNDCSSDSIEKDFLRRKEFKRIKTRVEYLGGILETEILPGRGKTLILTFSA